jgi:hypothetical protein
MEKQLELGFKPDLKKYAIDHISERGHLTTVTLQTNEQMSPQEINNILEEIMMNLQVYLHQTKLY